jgi:hypothetical protein
MGRKLGNPLKGSKKTSGNAVVVKNDFKSPFPKSIIANKK